VFGWLGGITLLIGLITAYRATAALATASSYAMITAFGSATAGTVSLRGGITNLIGALLGVRTSATTTGTAISTGLTAPLLEARGAMLGLRTSAVGASSALPAVGTSAVTAASGVQVLRASLLALGRATLVLGILQVAAELIFNFGESMQWLASVATPSIYWVADFNGLLADMFNRAANIVPALAEVYHWLANLFQFGKDKSKEFASGWTSWAAGLTSATKDFSSSVPPASAATDGFAGSLGDLGKSAGGAAKKVRTLVDYANDLQSVFSRAFDIRFKSQLAMDDVADSWADLTDRINEARIKLAGLTADRNIKQYFKSVADAYGDSLRGDKLAAEIADLNQQIAETQADASTELNGNTKAARQNRKTITDLARQYEDYVTALAEGGADQATLNNAVNASRAQFMQQAQALGYSNAQLQPYVASFGDLATAIARVPRNITVTPNLDPALQALNEFAAKAAAAGASAGNAFQSAFQEGAAKTARAAALQAQLASLLKSYNDAIARGADNYATRYLGQIQSIQSRLQSGSYAQGGYTGRGGKYEPAGIVHHGEFVVPKEQVNQRTGLPYASALGNLQAGTRAPRSSYASGGFVGSDRMIVDLSAQSMRAMNRPIQLVVDGQVVANVVYGNSFNQSLRGSN
jgi:hypothetical protein